MSNLLLLGAGTNSTHGSPSSSSLIRWFDANTLSTLWQDDGATAVTANNDPVGGWDDRTATITRARQVINTGFRPLYKTNILNGKPGIKFDGSNDYLEFDTYASIANMHESTLFIVVSGWTTGSYQGLFCRDIDVANDSYYLRIDNNDKFSVLEAGVALVGTSTNAASTAGAIIVTQISDTGNSYALQNGGTPEGSGAWAGTFTQTSGILGAQKSVGSGEWFTGYIHEFLLYNAVLGTDAKAQTINYLKGKWNL